MGLFILVSSSSKKLEPKNPIFKDFSKKGSQTLVYP
jgi:hypothetical protein